jgi:glycosyltransferase involved in cell wall biosynthesis
VLVPSTEIDQPWALETLNGVQVLRLKAFRTKDIGRVRRTISESLLSFAMWRGWSQSPLRDERWDGVIWYSPTIFLGPLAFLVKRASGCRGYLILRDIFPEWAVDMGLLRRGPVYWFFKFVERYQYSVADAIGVLSPSHLPYFSTWVRKPGRRLEVLQNWLAAAPDVGCRVSVAETQLAGRTIFVYAGNMGVAQGMDILLDLAACLRDRKDIGFLFVGRGSDVPRLRALATDRSLDNVVFRDEVEPEEVPGLLAQCHIGLLALDPRHTTHNVPGKFLTYMYAGLPVLARLNPGNDLAELIAGEDVGRVYVGDSSDVLGELAKALADDPAGRARMGRKARLLADREFSPAAAVRQVLAVLSR